jgi:hypothetical protein
VIARSGVKAVVTHEGDLGLKRGFHNEIVFTARELPGGQVDGLMTAIVVHGCEVPGQTELRLYPVNKQFVRRPPL